MLEGFFGDVVVLCYLDFCKLFSFLLVYKYSEFIGLFWFI